MQINEKAMKRVCMSRKILDDIVAEKRGFVYNYYSFTNKVKIEQFNRRKILIKCCITLFKSFR